ncbi:MAG: hypothetical protein IT582_01675 [Opitutaceae bacterium]|nr:hypothetical protein [Opitutaceae bacterium]
MNRSPRTRKRKCPALASNRAFPKSINCFAEHHRATACSQVEIAEVIATRSNRRALKFPIRALRAPEYIGSDPIERATWLNLIAYCCEQENGGVIAGAALWKDRQWLFACGSTRRQIQRAGNLLRWDGNNLVVLLFPPIGILAAIKGAPSHPAPLTLAAPRKAAR